MKPPARIFDKETKVLWRLDDEDTVIYRSNLPERSHTFFCCFCENLGKGIVKNDKCAECKYFVGEIDNFKLKKGFIPISRNRYNI